MPREETIQIKIDKSLTTAPISELKKAADELKQAFGSIKVGDSVKAITDQARAAQAVSKAEKDAANALVAHARAEKELENATNAKLRAQKTAQQIATEQQRTEKEHANALKASAQAIKATDQAQNQLNKTMTSGVGIARNMGNAMMSFAKQLIGFYGVTQVLRSALTEMKSMNDELTVYRKVTGATMQQMEAMRTKAYGAAKAYGQSPSDFLASAATMARAGYGEISAEMAELATKTQLVGDMTADAASQFLIAVDAAYKYKGNLEQLNSVLDSANELDNKYATTISKISEGITLVASLAATAKVPIEQMMAALGTMTATTQRAGSEAARGFRYILLHAMGDTTTEIEEGVTATEEGVKTLTDAVMKYGDESVKNAVKAGKLINPMEKIVALQKAYKEGALSNEDLYDIGVKVAGVRQYNMFMALVQNPEMYNSMLNDIANSTGSAQREIDAMMDSWSKKLERFKATWTETVNKTIDDGIIKYFLDLGTQALELSGSLANLTGVIGGLYAAIKLLKSGSAFGVFGFAVAGVSALKALGENQFSNSVQAAQKSAEASAKLVTSTNNLGAAIKKYQEIASDGVIDNTELATAKSLQEQIKNLVGDTAKNWDLVNGNVKDNIKLLGDAAKTYAKNAYSSARTNTANAGINVLDAANNWWNKATGEGFRYDTLWPKQSNQAIRDYIAKNFVGSYNELGGAYDIRMQNDFGIEALLKFYKSSKGLQELFAQSYSAEELSKINFYKDLTNGLNKMSPAMENYLSALEEEQKAYANQILIEDGYLDKKFETQKAFYQYIDALTEAKGLSAEQGKTLLEMAKTLGDVQDAAIEGASGLGEAANEANILTKAIEAATKAKEKFDDAMKESKADAFNSYQEAYQTYQKELKEGRVNSTAFHAAARMVLGDEVYYSAGGDSKKIRGLMNKKGGSGSAQQASDILYGTYKDEKGNVIQGGGLWQLLSKTKGFDKSLLTDKNGNWQIPDLEPYMKLITSQWGNLSEEAIRAAWNALDQYDREGKNTSDKLKQQKEEEGKKSEDLSNSTEKAAEGAEKLGDAATEAADATKAEAEAKQENTPAEGEQAEGASPLEAGVEQSGTILSNMQQAYEFYLKISQIVPAANIDPTTLAFAESMEYLIAHPDILVNIQQGQNTGDAVSAFSGIASAIQLIEKYAGTEEGSGLTVNANLVGDLGTQLQAMYATLSKEQKDQVDAYINLQDGTFKEELNKLLHPETPYSAEVSVDADTKSATDKADTAVEEIDGKSAEMDVGADTELATDAADTAVTNINEMAGEVSVGGDASGAISAADAAVNDINKKEATIDVKVKIHGVNNGNAYDYDYDANSDTLKYDEWLGFAKGTRNHPGGLSLVNDGTGPELILDRGRAFIAGDGSPTIVNLNKGAKVFTASETRSILSGNGVPAYATGTMSVSYEKEPGSVIGFGKLTLAEDEDTKKKTKKKARTKSKTKKEEVNEEAFKDLASMIDYIINRVGEALDEQLGIIDAQIDELKAARDAAKQQNELEERQKAVSEAQKDLAEALGERTVRYLGEDGKWHWMADARSVKSAQESLTKAQDSLREYEEDMAFNAQVEALENQKKVLQDEYDEITKTWSKIQDGVNTPTGELSKLIADVLAGGTDQEKKGATTAQSLLLNTLLGGGSYKGNYNEALDAIAKATAGNPVMPGEATATLASLIAMSGAGAAGGSITDTLKAGSSALSSGIAGGWNGVSGTQSNVNYFINGLQLGSDQANLPLSTVMKNLSVYTNTTVN